MKHAFDLAAAAAASHFMSWLERHVDVAKREWVGAMAAELNDMDTGWQRLTWALSGFTLVWAFRPAKAAEPQLVLSGSVLMNEPSPSVGVEIVESRLAELTALLLVVVVLGYIVFLLPVFQGAVASFGRTLDVAGMDFARLGIGMVEAAGVVFFIGAIYTARRPRVAQPRTLQTLLSGVNVLLGTSAVLLGVTLVQFVILLFPYLQQQSTLREREKAALYRLATVGDPAEADRVAKLGGVAAARFSALTQLSHEALRAGDAGPVARQVAQQLLSMLPQFEKHSEYADAVLYANLLAGHVAFNKRHDARRYLRAAGDRPDGPPMAFGPNMRLAKDLLDYGDRESVLVFLAQCRRFWPSGAERLDGWTRAIKAGGKPDFGRDLNN